MTSGLLFLRKIANNIDSLTDSRLSLGLVYAKI